MACTKSTTGPVTRAIQAMRNDTPTLIVPRRGFIARALGFTAAGAALSVPVLAVETPADRIAYHRAELEKAFREYYASAPVIVRSNDLTREYLLERQPTSVACLMFMAGPVEVQGGRA
jgi:hypothetical protein